MTESAVVAVEAPTLPTDPVIILEDVLKRRGWDARDAQLRMVEFIREQYLALEKGSETEGLPQFRSGDATVQAPVGTGKTLGYLIAAIARRERIVISTTTKALQDQIVIEELPRLSADLKDLYGFDLTYGVLKGKSNYPCVIHVKKALGDELTDEEELDLFDDADIDIVDNEQDNALMQQALADSRAAQAAGKTVGLDWERIFPQIVNPVVRRHIRASDKCSIRSEPWVDKEEAEELGPMARKFIPSMVAGTSEDIYRAAYALCMSSQVVVMNTTLLAFELRKAQAAMSETQPILLNGVGTIIVDEAHHLPRIIADTMTLNFDYSVAEEHALEAIKKLKTMYGDDADKLIGSFGSIVDKVTESEELIRTSHRNWVDGSDDEEYRTGISAAIRALLQDLHGEINELINRAIQEELRSPSDLKVDSRGCPVRVLRQIGRVHGEIVEPLNEIASSVVRRIPGTGKWATYLAVSPGDESTWCLIETVPIDVSFFRSAIADACKVGNYYLNPDKQSPHNLMVLCSGTISRKIAGLVGASTDDYEDVPSPFDPARVRMMIPTMQYTPKDQEWLDEAFDAAADAIDFVGGRTLLLTTSSSRMREFTELLRADLELPILSQADGVGKNELIRQFKEDERSVLVGTMGFWEGVDVPGPACSLVIMDKIPFPVVDNPTFEARREYIREIGGNSFIEVDVDYASIMLAQGAGRLIRSLDDLGGIMILDERARTARYSSRLLQLLPAEWPLSANFPEFLGWLEWVNPDTRNPEIADVPVPDPSVWSPIRRPSRRSRRRSFT